MSALGTYLPLAKPPPMVASDARTLSGCLGTCGVCGHLMDRGHRVCDLAGSGAVVHVACVIRAASEQ
jgi:hypothetical protein